MFFTKPKAFYEETVVNTVVFAFGDAPDNQVVHRSVCALEPLQCITELSSTNTLLYSNGKRLELGYV